MILYTLATITQKKLNPLSLCEVQLINGDHFRGNLKGTTDNSFLLDTWHSGRMTINRHSVRKIAPLAKGLKTILFTGRTGGKMENLADVTIFVPSDNTQRIQESHIMIGQILCGLIEKKIID